MIIRELKSDDVDMWFNIFMQVQNIHIQFRPDLYRQIESSCSPKAYYQTSLADPNKIMLGAVIEEKVVGICIVDIRQSEGETVVPRTYAHIKNIAVDENYRNKGIGKALYLEAVKRAKNCGADAIDLKVFSFNETAIGFYKSLGMTVQSLTMEQKICE